MSTKPLLLTAFTLLAATLITTARAASSTFEVDLDTAGLSAVSGDSLSLEFQLNSGGGTSSNTATVSNFQFTGGSGIAGTEYTFDNPPALSSGNFTTGFSLSTNPSFTPGQVANSTGFAYIGQNFDSSVTDIKFDVSVSDWTTGQTPTDFIVDIFDNTANNYISTTDPVGGLSLVTINLGRSANSGELLTPPAAFAYTGTGLDISSTVVPEPSTWALFLAGGLVFLIMRRRHLA